MTPISVEKLHEWVAQAQPGARLVYGHGRYARDFTGPKVHDKLNSLQSLGYIMMCQGKLGEGGRDYMAFRTSRDWPKSAMPPKLRKASSFKPASSEEAAYAKAAEEVFA